MPKHAAVPLGPRRSALKTICRWGSAIKDCFSFVRRSAGCRSLGVVLLQLVCRNLGTQVWAIWVSRNLGVDSCHNLGVNLGMLLLAMLQVWQHVVLQMQLQL
eukprot:Selendium_serpulae@DN8522_c0_g1_i1.p1